MTHDYLIDLMEACKNEGSPFLLIVGDKRGEAVRVEWDLDDWPNHYPLREDIHQLLDVTVFHDHED